MTHRLLRICIALVATATLAACTSNTIYRAEIEVCDSAQPTVDCRSNAIQRVETPSAPTEAYSLSFLEFDDQGQLWDRRQLTGLVDFIHDQSSGEDILMVVFAHGWQHNAAPEDSNIVEFRKMLRRVSAEESYFARASGKADRKVFGVYLGWRGRSVTVPGIDNLTFWDRKATAEQVGDGGVTEALSRLELIQQSKVSLFRAGQEKAVVEKAREENRPVRSRTRLAVVGHSFGGAVVYASVQEILKNRFVQTSGSPVAAVTDARGFGNLVILINPAFEASQFSTLSDMANERRTYFSDQVPVLAVLTSEADLATKIAFPLGRALSTVFENTRVVKRTNYPTGEVQEINQGSSILETIGHFAPYQTHELTPSLSSEEVQGITVEKLGASTLDVIEAWKRDAPGGKIAFKGSVLERNKKSVGRNPYLNIKVNRELIPNHNDIYDPRVTTFIRQLIFITAQ